eukprot:TRINITY_DN1327_c0_g1_i4.p1 TRINITY_DN1327_c0_g1~~TRINITY_DN1327_c0_g1_i4.p1  ORF type:complete len:1187 (+),score=179.79 TRINITY_DN1327_c0_g1_i4:1873-5433(+)
MALRAGHALHVLWFTQCVIAVKHALRGWVSRVEHWGIHCPDPISEPPEFALYVDLRTGAGAWSESPCITNIQQTVNKTGTWAMVDPTVDATALTVRFSSWDSDCFLCDICMYSAGDDCYSNNIQCTETLSPGIPGSFTCADMPWHRVTVDYSWESGCDYVAPSVTGAIVNCRGVFSIGSACSVTASNGYTCTGSVTCGPQFTYDSTVQCVVSEAPTRSPSTAPLTPGAPSHAPHGLPSRAPTLPPSVSPTLRPQSPTLGPSEHPTLNPTRQPSVPPSSPPSPSPSSPPSNPPSGAPTLSPEAAPTAAPSAIPSAGPSALPTAGPTATPTTPPTAAPSALPTTLPTAAPTTSPAAAPTTAPAAAPTATPSLGPSGATLGPSAEPSSAPSTAPSWPPATTTPTRQPLRPTRAPVALPTRRPSVGPSAASSAPSVGTLSPTNRRSAATSAPRKAPTVSPTAVPSHPRTGTPATTESASPTVAPSKFELHHAEATKNALGLTAFGSSLVSGSPLGASQGPRMVKFFDYATCPPDDHESLGFMANPTGAGKRARGSSTTQAYSDSRGVEVERRDAMLANLGIMGGAFAFFGLASVALLAFRRGWVAGNTRLKYEEAAGKKATIFTCMATMRCPSFAVYPALFMLQNVLEPAATLILYDDIWTEKLLAVLVWGVCAALAYSVWMLTSPRHFLAKVEVDAVAWSNPKWKQFLWGTSKWVNTSDPTFERRYALVFKDFTRENHRFLLVDVFVVMAISVVSAFHATNKLQCTVQITSATFVEVAYLAAVLRLKPFLAELDLWCTVVLTACQVAAILCALGAIHTGGAGYMTISAALLIIGTAVLAFKALFDVGSFVWDRCDARKERRTRRRQRQESVALQKQDTERTPECTMKLTGSVLLFELESSCATPGPPPSVYRTTSAASSSPTKMLPLRQSSASPTQPSRDYVTSPGRLRSETASPSASTTRRVRSDTQAVSRVAAQGRRMRRSRRGIGEHLAESAWLTGDAGRIRSGSRLADSARLTADSVRTRSDSTRLTADSAPAARSDSMRTAARDSARLRSDSTRLGDSMRTARDAARLRSDSTRLASSSRLASDSRRSPDSARVRSDPPRTRSDSAWIRSDPQRLRSDQPRSDSPRLRADPPRTRSDSTWVRADESLRLGSDPLRSFNGSTYDLNASVTSSGSAYRHPTTFASV